MPADPRERCRCLDHVFPFLAGLVIPGLTRDARGGALVPVHEPCETAPAMPSFRAPLVCVGVAVHVLSCGPDWDSLLGAEGLDGGPGTRAMPTEPSASAFSAPSATSTSEAATSVAPQAPSLIRDLDAGPLLDAGADGGFDFEMAR